MKKKILVHVSWSGRNYNATIDDIVPGAVVVTNKTYEGLKSEVSSALDFHIEGLIANGEEIPDWLRARDYELQFELNMAALLQVCGLFTSLAAISHASGINQRQLSHYANGIKNPRPEQKRKILEGLGLISKQLEEVKEMAFA